jgi:general nucleoside transport system permease protein
MMRLPAVRLEPTNRPSQRSVVGLKVLGALVALLGAGIILELTGKDAIGLGDQALQFNLGSWAQTQQLLINAAPLAMGALAVYIGYRVKIWNIGVDGQMYAGAIAAAAIGLNVSHGSEPLLLVAMALAAVAAGALWILVPALLRAFWGVNEVITTLLLNFVALKLTQYLATSVWNDAQTGAIRSSQPLEFRLPELPGTVMHIGVLAPLVVAGLVAFLFSRTAWGYEVGMIGDNARAATAAGMPTRRRIVSAMLLSGAVAGITGMITMTGTLGSFSEDVAARNGLYGFIVVALAGAGGPFVILAVSFLVAILLNSGVALATEGVSADTVLAIYGFILLLGGLGELATRYRLRIVRPRPRAAPPPTRTHDTPASEVSA